MQFKLEFWIDTTTDAEMDAAMLWIRDNHGTEVIEAKAVGTSKAIILSLSELTFNDAMTTRDAFKAQFTTQLTDWEFSMTQDPA